MTFWIDKNNKKHSREDVTDNHLLNIIDHLAKGGGWMHFLNEDKIDDIYDEALARKLVPRKTRSECKSAYRNRYEIEFGLDEVDDITQ